MHNFKRAFKLALAHRLNVAVCVVTATIVAVLWGGNLTAVYPVVEIIMEIAREESVEEVSQDLRDLEGLTPELIRKLAEGGVNTRDDLADLAVDELQELTGVGDELAKTLIMKAREHWFST